MTVALTTACVFNPRNETRYRSTASSVFVSGYGPSAGTRFDVVVGSSPSGPWTVVRTLTAERSGIPISNGVYYPFSGFIQVPSTAWVVEGCDYAAYLRVRLEGSTINAFSFDNRTPDGRMPENCVIEELSASGNPSTVSVCASPDSPTIRITAPGPQTRVTGHLTLNTAAQVAARTCLEEVTGTLTIAPSISQDIALPNLRTVGRLQIDYPVKPTPGFSIQDENYERAFPQLTTVRGDIEVSATASPNNYLDLNLGMASVTRVDGDVDITLNGTSNKSVRGLAALTQIGGGLTVDGPGNDFTGIGFLTGLDRVQGSVNLDIGNPQPTALLATLTTVDGALNLSASNMAANTLQSLQSVGADLTITRVGGGTVSFAGSGRALPALLSVGGMWTLSNLNGVIRNFDIGGSSVNATGLTLLNTQATSFSSAGLQIIGGGTIRIENNPQLCTTAIDAFLAGQSSWTGSSVVAGNNAGC